MFNIYVEFEAGRPIDVDLISTIVPVSKTECKVILRCGKNITVPHGVEELQSDVDYYLNNVLKKKPYDK